MPFPWSTSYTGKEGLAKFNHPEKGHLGGTGHPKARSHGRDTKGGLQQPTEREKGEGSAECWWQYMMLRERERHEKPKQGVEHAGERFKCRALGNTKPLC